MFASPERRLNALKRIYRREVLRIGSRDILGHASLQVVTEELSDLADAMVAASCDVALGQLAEKLGPCPETPYVVIGLGKLGGRELNYSSDIDILFVYKDEGERVGMSYHHYFNKFVEQMVQNLSQPSTEGHLYRVDTRLRPESGAGPLARSLKSYLLYYEARGELWERQMLIKARPMAGSLEFGEEVLAHLEPFVYPRTFFHSPSESIARVKARIETSIGDEENIKLWAGGIRDVEFIVQGLQLINGGKNPAIRGANTLRSLDLLSSQGLLSTDEAGGLHAAYTFFRTLEHRLQTMLNTQTHSMPADETTLHTLARRMGFSEGHQLRDAIARHRSTVKRVFKDVLSVVTTGEPPDIVAAIDGGLTKETIGRVLHGYGFQDTDQASKYLKFIVSGSALSSAQEVGHRTRESLRFVARDLFGDIGKTPNPNLTLANIVLLLGGERFPEHFFRQLGEPGFRRLVLRVCGASPRFARGLAGDHLFFEEITGSPHMLEEGFRGVRVPTKRIPIVKRREELRAGIRYVLGLITLPELAGELSSLADAVVSTVLKTESARMKLKNPPLAIFALGKYGTREIAFDADLDVIFVARERSARKGAQLEKLASAVVQQLSASSSEGKMYDVDARLRPEGKNAPLVVDSAAYASYLTHRASLWERQSLTRLRPVAGHKGVVGDVTRLVDRYVYGLPLPDDWVDVTVAMRKKTETRSLTQSAGYFDFKLGAGGMVDVEFLAQMIQLKFGAGMVDLKGLQTTEVLRTVRGMVLPAADSDRLIEAYGLYRQLETLLRITLDDRSTLLPEGATLDLLAACLDGRTSGEHLRTRLGTMMKETRALFLTHSHRLRSR
jgi:glutamate-ammonia-ligase adenylyltransferase